MRKWSRRSLRNLDGIHPDLRRVMDRALQEAPHDFLITEGLRTPERQAKLKAAGASRTLNSRHLTGHAVDIAVLLNGGVVWDWPVYEAVSEAVKKAAIAEGVALTWGGDWPSLRDGPHYELRWDAYPVSDWTSGKRAPDRKPVEVRDKSPMRDAATQGGAVVAVGPIVETALREIAPNLADPWGRYALIAAVVVGVAVAIWRFTR